MKLRELCRYLDEYLQLDLFPRDISQNGLQVEGPVDINTIAVAVDARTSTITQAAELGAQMLLVHHGLFWGQSELLRGPHYRKIKLLIEHQVSLYAAHLPLDAHLDVGNNAVFAKLLHLREVTPWAQYKGQTIGIQGKFASSLSLPTLLSKLEAILVPWGGTVQHFGQGPNKIKRIGIITGDAANEIPTAAQHGLDALITGEPSHVFVIAAEEHGIHLICGGHYATETLGVKALAQHLEETFSLRTHFIHHPTGA